ncbi:methyltransferase [Streptomyces pactum]|uniref:Methyltransferase n=1 Tax=Streptomyces pactum TaxID=68249 RepID=A0ABS0NE67_9ACTN|nr:HemK2/MTQ2 family protein methyltransferase [Streptomyces pactum]MBH5333485.1 methyltransferase [Streptomyces pactum]
MFLLRPPAVYRPQGDSELLGRALLRAAPAPGAQVLDVCTGTGVIAIAAARLGAARVHAVDISASAVLATSCNAWLRRLPVRAERGDFLARAAGRRYDVVTANPPYVPTPPSGWRHRRRSAAWDAGEDGRACLDRLCAAAPRLLRENGMMLLVHSALCGTETTLRRLREAGLRPSVVDRQVQPFGPVMTERAPWLEERGLIEPGQRTEELVVIRADR